MPDEAHEPISGAGSRFDRAKATPLAHQQGFELVNAFCRILTAATAGQSAIADFRKG
jgi:hypothetical protein